MSLQARGQELAKLLEQLLGAPYAAGGRRTCIDLESKANAKLAEGFHDSSQGNNLAELPKG